MKRILNLSMSFFQEMRPDRGIKGEHGAFVAPTILIDLAEHEHEVVCRVAIHVIYAIRQIKRS